MNAFAVSVVIPVYNAAAYVRKAVESAVNLREVGEVVLVEDASPDNALVICMQLQNEYPKVQLYRHPNGENRGAGASRNLGISKSTCPFIAFLDADDYYLPHRFKEDQRILTSKPEVDGVYSPVGVHYYTDDAAAKFAKAHLVKQEELSNYSTYLRTGDGPIYWRLIQGRHGFCHTDGITIRKLVLEKTGLFNVQLRLHQDTDLWIRIAYHGNLVEGAHEPVAIRGVHSENRIHNANRSSKYLYYESLFQYFKNKPIPFGKKIGIFAKMVSYHPKRRFTSYSNMFKRISRGSEIAVYAVFLIPKFFKK